MALQVWLPLDGSVENLGLDDIQVVNQSISGYSNGKIGQALDTLGSYYYFDIPSLVNATVFSCAFWFKQNSSSSLTTNWRRVVDFITAKDGETTTGAFRFESSYGIDNHALSTHSNASYYLCPSTVGNRVLVTKSGEWHHVAVTVSGTTITYYVDGNLHHSGAQVDGYLTGRVSIGETGNQSDGWLNDVRIYDHALSAKEVKELSKALIAHYPLNDYHSFGPINKYSSPYSDGELSACSWTKTKLPDERGWNYKLTRTGNGTNFWANGAVPNFTFTAGKTYCYSLKIRCNKWTNEGLVFRAARANNDWVTIVKNVCSSSKADGKWHEYYICQTVPETFDRSGTTMTSNPRIELYTGNLVTEGTVYDMDFDIKDIQVVESDSYVPFIDNDITDSIIYDASGYGHDLTSTAGSVSNIEAESGSPRYTVGTIFSKSAKYGASVLIGTSFTLSMWLKLNEFSSNWAGYIRLQHSNNEYIGICDGNAEGKIGAHIYKDVDGSKINQHDGYVDGWTTGEWFHAAVVVDGKSFKFYRNGATCVSRTMTYDTTEVIRNIYLNSNNGITGYHSLSDVRIYATALSAEEIKELYEVSASVDQNGNTWAYELVEE